MTAGLPIIGCRVRLAAPDTVDPGEFLAAVEASHSLHHPWVAPPSDRAAFAAYVERMARPDQFGFIARRADDGALAGVVNINNVV
ncbi:MAG: RimJ/RimL family protein N-acetyltransferase, partial [Actinomycetota bacterium]